MTKNGVTSATYFATLRLDLAVTVFYFFDAMFVTRCTNPEMLEMNNHSWNLITGSLNDHIQIYDILLNSFLLLLQE